MSKDVSAAPATALQYSVSKHRFKVIVDGDVLSVGAVHGAAQYDVNAKHFRNSSIYCKNTYSASGHKPRCCLATPALSTMMSLLQ